MLYAFSGSPGGASRGTKLVMYTAGNLYGTSYGGGVYGYGSVFKLTPSSDGWTYASLHDFTGGSDGANPDCGLAFDTDGSLYGTASFGGDLAEGSGYGCGVIFQVTP